MKLGIQTEMYMINKMKITHIAGILASACLLVSCGQQEAEKFDLELSKQQWNRPGKQWTEAELRLLATGETLYRRNCSVCHARDGQGDIQLGAPALYNSPIVTGPGSSLIQLILEGKKGTVMPAFADALSDQQVAEIATYVRNAWGNDVLDSVMREEVKQLR